jgi:hypothetical protein
MISLVAFSLLAMLQVGDTVRMFPVVEGRNLEGQTLVMPRDFAGDVNVVFVAFKREQQADVDSWAPTLDTLRARRPGVRVYELPTLAREYRLMRRFIDGGMRGGIPDSAVRAATITLYIDKAPFKRALGITSEDHIQVFVVDRGGRIRWQGSGRYTPALWTKMQEALRTALER